MTFDWPAASKVAGFVGHNGKKPCRLCHKESFYISNLKGNYLIPSGAPKSVLEALRAEDVEDGESWITEDCPMARTNKEIRRTWMQIEEVEKNGRMQGICERRQIVRNTRIKRNPVVSKLFVHFAHGIPSDPMHSLLLGWVSHLVYLHIGHHARCVQYQSPFCSRKAHCGQ